MAGKFETYTGSNGQHYFRLKAGNGEVILTSQGYKAKNDCASGIEFAESGHPRRQLLAELEA